MKNELHEWYLQMFTMATVTAVAIYFIISWLYGG